MQRGAAIKWDVSQCPTIAPADAQDATCAAHASQRPQVWQPANGCDGIDCDLIVGGNCTRCTWKWSALSLGRLHTPPPGCVDPCNCALVDTADEGCEACVAAASASPEDNDHAWAMVRATARVECNARIDGVMAAGRVHYRNEVLCPDRRRCRTCSVECGYPFRRLGGCEYACEAHGRVWDAFCSACSARFHTWKTQREAEQRAAEAAASAAQAAVLARRQAQTAQPSVWTPAIGCTGASCGDDDETYCDACWAKWESLPAT